MPNPTPAEVKEAVELAKAYREMKTQEYSMMHIDPKSHPNRMIALLTSLEAAERERDEARILKTDAEALLESWKYRATRAEARCKEFERVGNLFRTRFEPLASIPDSQATCREWDSLFN